jgi:hypothetical protein
MDLVNSQFHFGFFAFATLLTCLLVFAQRRHFFEERLISAACYTALISLVFTAIQLLFLALFEKSFPLKWPLLLTDLLLMPLCDALYGLCWFTYPMRLIQNFKKRRKT